MWVLLCVTDTQAWSKEAELAEGERRTVASTQQEVSDLRSKVSALEVRLNLIARGAAASTIWKGARAQQAPALAFEGIKMIHAVNGVHLHLDGFVVRFPMDLLARPVAGGRPPFRFRKIFCTLSRPLYVRVEL